MELKMVLCETRAIVCRILYLVCAEANQVSYTMKYMVVIRLTQGPLFGAFIGRNFLPTSWSNKDWFCLIFCNLHSPNINTFVRHNAVNLCLSSSNLFFFFFSGRGKIIFANFFSLLFSFTLCQVFTMWPPLSVSSW